MSLQTDRVFYAALKASDDLAELVDDRIFNTAIPGTDEDADNEPVPYIVVTFDGMNNDGTSKDDPYEGDTDVVNIGIEVAANDREQLATIADLIRSAVHTYFSTYEYTLPENSDEEAEEDLTDEIPEDYYFSAQAVQYDAWKPCFWQVLSYRCDTKRLDYGSYEN